MELPLLVTQKKTIECFSKVPVYSLYVEGEGGEEAIANFSLCTIFLYKRCSTNVQQPNKQLCRQCIGHNKKTKNGLPNMVPYYSLEFGSR